MAKTILGYITDETGVSLPGVIVTAVKDPANANTTTDTNGNFTLVVPDNETQLNFYTNFLAGGQLYKTFTIPTPTPSVWNIRLQLEGPVISAGNKPATEKKKTNLWPVYAGAGLLLLLWLRKRKKKRGKK